MNSLLVLDENSAAHIAELFRAFSDTSRVRILSALIGQVISVNSLAQLVGISDSGISHHLSSLRQMTLVQARRDGKEVYYRVIDEHLISLFRQGVRHVPHG